MEYLISYIKIMVIITLLRELFDPSPNGKEEVYTDLVSDTTWMIQNPQWGSNFYWISAANEEISGNFISHLLDYGFDSVIKSLDKYLGMDSLVLLLVTFMGV